MRSYYLMIAENAPRVSTVQRCGSALLSWAAMNKRALIPSLVLALAAAPAFAQRPDFNGTWRLDDRASRVTTGEGLEGLGKPAPETLYITQRRNGQLVMSSRLPGSETREYVLGGQTWVPAPRPSTGRFVIRSRVHELSMVSEASGEVEGEMVNVREVLTMDPGGRKITLEVTTTRSWGPETNLLVYNRVGGSGAPGGR